MTTQILRPIKPVTPHIRIEAEPEQGVYWGFMHASESQHARPCCTLPIIEDGIALQEYASRQHLLRQSGPQGSQLSHLVLASEAPVFSLGGDLALFISSIRSRDHQTLLTYALRCVDAVFGFQDVVDGGIHSIALVQGDALGGGFEVALSCNTIVAEEGVTMGFPEVLFGLFPGMGAYSFLRKRVSANKAQRMILDAHLYTSNELYEMGIVDILAPRGTGIETVENLIHQRRRSTAAHAAVARVHMQCERVPLAELQSVTTTWVDTALQLGEKSLQTIERILRAQARRFESASERSPTALETVS